MFLRAYLTYIFTYARSDMWRVKTISFIHSCFLSSVFIVLFSAIIPVHISHQSSHYLAFFYFLLIISISSQFSFHVSSFTISRRAMILPVDLLIYDILCMRYIFKHHPQNSLIFDLIPRNEKNNLYWKTNPIYLSVVVMSHAR